MDNTKQLTIEQFGQTIKAKYPAYSSKGDAEVGQAMLKKYPQYQSRIMQGPKTTASLVEPKEPGYFSRVGGEYKKAGENIVSGIQKSSEQMQQGQQQGGLKGLGTFLSGTARAAARTVGGVAQAAFAPITEAPIVKPALEKAGEAISNIPGVTSVAQKGMELARKHPEIAKDIQNIVDTATLGIGKTAEKPLAEAGKIAGEKGVKKISSIFEKAAEKSVTRTAEKETALITEKIMPKATIKEAKLAEMQGRLVKAKEPTLFKAGGLDVVSPSSKVEKAAQTIKKYIPEASKLDEPTLYTSLDNKTGEIARNLKPEMKKVVIGEPTVKKITTDWENLKKSQIEAAPATEEANVLKRQSRFESFLKTSKSETMDDLWDTRKVYDDTVHENVKRANELSSESLQMQKDEWLQNRNILNEAINDASTGLGKTSKEAFSDMTDMYTAKTNLLTKAKVETKIKPSKIRQFFQSGKGKSATDVIKAGATFEGLKRLVTGEW